MTRWIAVLVCLVGSTACGKAPPPPSPAPERPAAQVAPKAEPAAPAAAPKPAKVKLPPGITAAVGAVATVNGRDVPAEQFNRELARLVGTSVRVPKDRVRHIARNILNRLIENELRHQAIATERIVLTEPEFEEAYRAYTSRYVDAGGRFDEARFQAALKRNRVTIGQLKSQIRRERLARKLVQKLGNVSVSDAELKAFYENNNNSWVEDESRDVRPILVRCPPNPKPAEAEACKKKAAEVFDALKAGGDFEQIAERFGDTPPRAPMHLTRSSPEVALARAAFSLKVGEVHAPVRTRWGYFVVRLIEKNKARVRSFEEVADDIRNRLTERKYYLEGLRIVKDLRVKAKVVTRLPF